MPLTPEQALACAGRRSALSHESAAVVWGLALLEPPEHRLTVPRAHSRRRVPGWVVVRSDLAADEVQEVAGLRTTGVVRTVRDLSRVLPLPQAVVAADSALREGLVTAEELAAGLSGAFGRGSDRPRSVAAAMDPASGSVLESLLRLLFWQVLPGAVSQFEVRDRWGEFVARVDLCWPDRRLVVEGDGFAFHSDRAAYRRDRERLNDLERLGWRVLRFTWEDVVGRPEHVVAVVRECLHGGRP